MGTGFDKSLLESLLEKLKKIEVSNKAFECELYRGRVTWVEPKYVCEVVYMAVTPDPDSEASTFEAFKRRQNTRRMRP